MSCPFDKEKLSGYFDGELEAAEKLEVEKHISACSECLRELGELKSSAQLVKTLPRLKAPASVAQGVAREVASTGRVHSLERYRKSIGWTFAAAAALLIVANVTYFAGRSSETPGPAASPMAGTAAKIPSQEQPTAPPADALRRARESSDRNGADALNKLEQEKAPTGKSGFGGRAEPLPAEEKAKSVERKDKDDAGAPANRALAANPKPAAPFVQKAPAPEPELEKRASEGLAKKTELGAAAPPTPPSAPAKAMPDARREALKETDKAAARDAEQQQQKQRADGAPAPAFQYAIATAQPAATRARAREILGKLGVQDAQAKAKSDEAQSGPLAVELTPTQFAELKRQLEIDSGVALVVMAEGGQGYRQAGGIGGGTGAKPSDDGKLQAQTRGAEEAKKSGEPAPGAEARKNLDAKGQEFKDAKDPQKPAAAAAESKAPAQAEAPRKYLLYFQDLPAKK